MAASKTEICNMAIAHLGQAKPIDDFDTDRGVPARACRTFYEEALKETLRDFDWPFARKVVDLALLTTLDEDDDHPHEEWQYAYRYPSEALAFRKILSGSRQDTQATKVPFEQYEDSDGIIILTDQEDAQAQITILREDVERYPSDFVLAQSRKLAFLIAPLVTGGDTFRQQEKQMKLYMMQMDKAQANMANEEVPDEMPDAEHLVARNS